MLVSTEDYDFINDNYTLYVDKNGYVFCRMKYKNKGLPKGKLHRIIMNPPSGKQIHVDHINGNKLNNTRENLRICTHEENMRNRKPNNQEQYSKYKGVSWHKQHKRWYARITYENQLICIGYFTNELSAASAYNHYALKLFGEFALLNDIPSIKEDEWKKDQYIDFKTSQYRGVSFSDNKWVAQIWNGEKNIVIGRYTDEKEAALAYNQKAIELKGERAKLNII